MKNFINLMNSHFIRENFLLETKSAQELYHRYAASLPIIDHHCHLSPKDIAENRRFENLTQIWLNGDHYKWRAMRTCGVDERLITGNASDWEKFQKWAETVPKTLRNPLYHWIHLELNRPVGINIFASRSAFRRLRAFSLTLLALLQSEPVRLLLATKLSGQRRHKILCPISDWSSHY